MIYFLWFILLLALQTPHMASGQSALNALATEINGPTDIASDGSTNLFIVEQVGRHLSRLDLQQGTIHRLSLGKGDSYAHAIAADKAGGLYIAEFDGGLQHLNLRSGARDIIIKGVSGSLREFDSIAVDSSGILYLSQSHDHRVLAWNPSTRAFSVVAGTGKKGFAGDGGPADKSMLSFPEGLALTLEGDLLVADYGNCRIRKVDLRSHVITTVAGTGTNPAADECGFSGDGGPALQAQLRPNKIAVDPNGAVLIVGSGNRVRRIDPITGVISTLAGTGENKSAGDGGPALKASLAGAAGVAVDSKGNIYISEYTGNRIRKIDAVSGIITTVAGNGKPLRADAIL
ncbi:MAG TPA: hypothetical protein VGK24_02350 [Candidatus Angelobacter sp.]|jgi:streptogramin lyase